MKNIFVGNLSFHTTEADLRTAFEPYGAVSRVSIMTDRDTGRSRGFGFVEMEEGASEAIRALDNQDFEGRKLKVNEAKPKEAGSRGRRVRSDRWTWGQEASFVPLRTSTSSSRPTPRT